MDTNTQNPAQSGRENPFCIRPANEWLEAESLRQAPRMLFDSFWFEGELCILFADTNVGKSVLAVQIGESLCTGIPIAQFKVEVPPRKVLYFDFEQVARQFNARYTLGPDRYNFSNLFLRAELDLLAGETKGTANNAENINHFIEQAIVSNKADVVIIDNLTHLRNDAERARDALLLMKHLKMLKSKYNLSILALAHTPKRNASRPVTQNDLQGSKMLINFCDSAFAAGQSQAFPDRRYLKQIKQRNAMQEYGADNVCVFQVEKPGNFLNFRFIEFDDENRHLEIRRYESVDEMKESILELYHQGYSQRRISSRLKIGKGSVYRLLQTAGVL
jgi:hypothetical protein